MVRIKGIICWIILQCCITVAFASDKDMVIVKQHMCESYLRILNDQPELRDRVADIVKNMENPDIMIRELKEGVNQEVVADWLATLGTNGSWKDLNYQDASRSGWQPSIHAERLMIMTKAYRDATGKYFQDRELGKAIHQCLSFWFAGNFRCQNWWYNQIGVPKMLGTVFLLMEPEMNAQEKAAAVKYMENAQLGMTGQNSVWLAENVLVRALLLENEPLFLKARDAILKELKINDKGEGIRPDWSFHQHGPQLQFGNYGLAFANTMTYWARMFQGTRFALTNQQMEVLRNYLLEGMQWIVWKRNMDISSCGRQLFRNSLDGKALSYGKAIRNMEVADGTYSQKYKQLYSTHILADGSSNELTGNRYFPFSDFGVHRDKNWYATLKMSSSRVVGSEIVNSENLSGYYMGDGALFVYRNGDEFRDIFPVWDWTQIPGVTCYDDPLVFKKNKAYTYQNVGDFVGGISDGTIGVSAMILDKNGLTGYKSYFFTGDAIVCLGSDIQGDKSFPVTTAVAQCLRKGEVRSGQVEGMEAFYHDGIAYVFQKGSQVRMTAGIQTGNWRKVAAFYDTAVVKKDIFALNVLHGQKPVNGKYAYTIIPDVAEVGWEKRVRSSLVKILSQDDYIHAILDKNGCQAVFFTPGTVEWKKNLKVSAEQPCLVMMRDEKKGIRFLVSDPTWKQKDIVLRLTGAWKGKGCRYEAKENVTTVIVPVDGMRGAVVDVNLLQMKNK